LESNLVLNVETEVRNALERIALAFIGRNDPLSLLMGKKLEKSHEEKMPACPGKYFSGNW
jgi:hypothetical protein